MQGNGFKIFLTAFFVLLCGYYLYPSVQNLLISQQMNDLEGEAREEYVEDNYARIQNVRENSLKLGLDLLGGMHVTLEVRVDNLISQLASNKDDAFNEVLEAARAQARSGDASVIDAFVSGFEERDPDARLSRYFRNDEQGITRRSTNAEVVEYLQRQADEAVTRAMEIVRNRVDRYGVTEPSIQRQGDRRIVVELPGIDEPERIRDLLRGTARLEFRLMGNPQLITQSVQEIIEYYETAPGDAVATVPESDTTDGDTTEVVDESEALATDEVEVPEEQGTSLIDPTDSDTGDAGTSLAGADEEAVDNPILAAMQPLPYRQSVVFGLVFEQDTSQVNDLLSRPEVQAMLPEGVEVLYSANPARVDESGREAYELIAVRSDPELTGDAITDASVEFDQFTNQPRVSMTMNSEGARTWSRVTGANVGENIAIVLDGVVYSYPNVEERITGGRSSITGLDSRQEAQDIVTILKSGALPAPVDIVEERTVGPSLGEASIQAGFISVVVGLLVVALFMILYYRTAGVVADIALLLNIILILGILAGFKATLTLPGIAGIVLTIGMAVDANVLIFERIREEQRTGKTLKAAINAGYDKALSAILDANITTFFVGAILYSFGAGPIQGFAVTLMAGILSSLFTAIIVTRLLFDYMVSERQMSVSYG